MPHVNGIDGASPCGHGAGWAGQYVTDCHCHDVAPGVQISPTLGKYSHRHHYFPGGVLWEITPSGQTDTAVGRMAIVRSRHVTRRSAGDEMTLQATQDTLREVSGRRGRGR